MHCFLIRILALILVLALNACSTMPRFGGSNNAVNADTASAEVIDRYDRALDEMKSGKDSRAIELFESFVAAYPEYPGASLNLAKLQLRNDNSESAIEVLQN
ncbi:MAG: tetratricopeptide repeat protein, partial [Gammaproteobacteria bacterium]|nr:tetratricopeptide repeat protein [Gammaproteobacteria bacterium]